MLCGSEVWVKNNKNVGKLYEAEWKISISVRGCTKLNKIKNKKILKEVTINLLYRIMNGIDNNRQIGESLEKNL